MNRKSDIEVTLFDFSDIEKNAIDFLQRKNPDRTVIEACVCYKWGYVETESGTFVLSDEGVGSMSPLSLANPVRLNIFGKYRDKEGSLSGDIMPVAGFNLTNPEEAKEKFGTEETENLAVFIRKFGHRLESNFWEWNNALEQLAIGIKS